MRLYPAVILSFSLIPICSAQLSQQQKIADFNQLAALYAVNYGPYELKRDIFGFDLYNLQPWLDQVAKSGTDIDFYDICTRYVASLQDSHDEFITPAFFDAWLHFDGDIYDGKFLIDFIDRTYLPRAQFAFAVGDELLSVDGTPVATLLQNFAPYAVNGSSNAVSRARLAAATITERYQAWYPRAGDIGQNATIVVQRQTGATETYAIHWDVNGAKLVNVGLIPVPHVMPASGVRPGSFHKRGADSDDGPNQNRWGIWTGAPATFAPDAAPPYMTPLTQLDNLQALAGPANFDHFSGLSPFDRLSPVFNPPAGFTLRLGSKSTDQFVSGTFQSGDNTIGFIRIPSFSPSSTTAALTQFAAETAYFNQNTAGLIVDIMANGGGSGCYAQSIASYLIPYTFQGLGQQLRATAGWRESFAAALTSAKSNGAPQWVLDLYTQYLAEIDQALAQNRGRTGDLPLCGYTFDANPPVDRSGAVLSYTKPILVLTDNFTLSAAEIFAMFLQDNQRATIFGMRTSGGGGNVVAFPSATTYSQGEARVTEGLIQRLNPVATPGYPAMLFYDGVGIYPDIVEDYMTADNLMNGGATFVKDATAALNDVIAKAK